MKLHPDGEGSNAWFQKGCGCDECRKAKNKRNNIYRKANSLAAEWVKKHYPRKYEEFLDEAYIIYDDVREKNGGNHGSPSKWNYYDV